MKLISINGTEMKVSPIGLGTVKFGRNQAVKYPQGFNLPDDKTISSLLSCAKSLGINLLDTAPAYGSSEERLGNILKTQRKDWIISTKVGEEFLDGMSYYDFSKKHVIKSIERSLQRLHTDYLDIVLVHSNGDDKKIIEEDTIFDVLSSLKSAGKIRAFGMSTKTIEGGLLTVQNADIVMVTYNPLEQQDKKIIEYADSEKKGVFIKKGLASGHLNKISSDNPVKNSLQFIYQQKGVTSVIVGTLNEEHLRFNVNCFNQL